jgi:hypothetical protein
LRLLQDVATTWELPYNHYRACNNKYISLRRKK